MANRVERGREVSSLTSTLAYSGFNVEKLEVMRHNGNGDICLIELKLRPVYEEDGGEDDS